VISEHILTELAGTFTDPYFTRRLPAPRIAEALDSVRIDAVVQPLTVAVSGIASHAEDDVVLATELSAGAEFLVTGDKELRQLGAYGGTRLLLPREFLTELDRQVAGLKPARHDLVTHIQLKLD
jgi:predicted nucleic acid-binding protein